MQSHAYMTDFIRRVVIIMLHNDGFSEVTFVQNPTPVEWNQGWSELTDNK